MPGTSSREPTLPLRPVGDYGLVPNELLPDLPERYIIQRRLERGGNGQVYLAVDQLARRSVAVKWIPTSEYGLDSRWEAGILAQLQHPNIPTLYDWGRTALGSYLVMEYFPGHDLSWWVQTRGPLPPERVWMVVEQVLSALKYAHSRGVFHGDIKPENIVMDELGIVGLTDFGASRTSDGRGLGGITHRFSAPEVKEGKGGAAADLYSLAATVMYLLGKPVGGRPSPRRAMESLRRGKVNPRVRRFLAKALDSEPAKRPSLAQWEEWVQEVRQVSPSQGFSWLQGIQRGARALLHWRGSRVLLAMECAGLVYLIHNLQVAGNLLFPVPTSMVRQMMLPGAAFLLSLLNLRAGLLFALWSFLPVLITQVLGWAVAYFFFLLVITPIASLAPQGMLQALIYPFLQSWHLGLALAVLLGRHLGRWKALWAASLGQWLFLVGTGLSLSPFMAEWLQYGLISAGRGLQLRASWVDGLLPALVFSVNATSAVQIAVAGFAGWLAGGWLGASFLEGAVAGVVICLLVALTYGIFSLPIPWYDLALALGGYLLFEAVDHGWLRASERRN
ncbi:MAG: serine/threonine protein kinase [Firmicutes bacterium]|nr:serine/threonine protein kinase [Bacillota bacterium]